MVVTFYVHQDLKELVENYLVKNNPEKEHGGFFLGRGFELIIVRFIPNTSKMPENTYSMPNNYVDFIKIDMQLTNLDLSIHFHTHPTHSVVSGQDIDVARQNAFSKFNLLIKYDKNNNRFTWQIYDGYEEQYIQVISREYETFKSYFAKSHGLCTLGEVYLTSDGGLLVQNSLGKMLLVVDEETLKVYNHLLLLEKSLPPYRKGIKIIKKDLERELGLSIHRINKALLKIKESGIIRFEE